MKKAAAQAAAVSTIWFIVTAAIWHQEVGPAFERLTLENEILWSVVAQEAEPGSEAAIRRKGLAEAILRRSAQDDEEDPLAAVEGPQRRVGPDPAFANTATPLRNWEPFLTLEEVDRAFRAQYVFELTDKLLRAKWQNDIASRFATALDRVEALEAKHDDD